MSTPLDNVAGADTAVMDAAAAQIEFGLFGTVNGVAPAQLLSQSTSVTTSPFTSQVLGQSIPIVIGSGPVPGVPVYGAQKVITSVYLGTVDPSSTGSEPSAGGSGSTPPAPAAPGYLQVSLGVFMSIEARIEYAAGPETMPDQSAIDYLYSYNAYFSQGSQGSSPDGVTWGGDSGFTFVLPPGTGVVHPTIWTWCGVDESSLVHAPKVAWNAASGITDTGALTLSLEHFDEGLDISATVTGQAITELHGSEFTYGPRWALVDPTMTEITGLSASMTGMSIVHGNGHTYDALATKKSDTTMYVLFKKRAG